LFPSFTVSGNNLEAAPSFAFASSTSAFFYFSIFFASFSDFGLASILDVDDDALKVGAAGIGISATDPGTIIFFISFEISIGGGTPATGGTIGLPSVFAPSASACAPFFSLGNVKAVGGPAAWTLATDVNSKAITSLFCIFTE